MLNTLSKRNLENRLSIFIGVTLVFIVFITWWLIDIQRDISLKKLMTNRTNELTSYIEADIRSRVPAIDRIKNRWQVRGGTPKVEFLNDVNAYIKNLPGFQALEWVDKDFHVRWIAPLKGNEQAQDLDLAFEKNRRSALEVARDKGIPTMTSPINLVQGGKGFLIYSPIFVNEKFDGFVLAVFRIDKWIDHVFNLKKVISENENYKVAVKIDEQIVYEQQGWYEDKNDYWQSESKINLMGHIISVSAIPTKQFFNKNKTNIAEFVAVVGVFFSILIAFMAFLQKKMKTSVAMVREINVDLEKNIVERKKAEDEAVNASQAKSQFLSAMSHELRTPLNAILGFSELLELDAKDELTRGNLQEIINAGNHLLELINEILDLSTIESGYVELFIESYELKKLVDHILSWVKPLANEQSIQIYNKIIDIPDIHVDVDKTRFNQVLLNLVSNAIKYNSDNGSIVIDGYINNENMFNLSITDSGKGLTIEQQDKLFNSFERLDENNSYIQGTGLGLVIAKDLMELMGGTIGVESEVGTGSTFWIEIPLSEYILS